MKPIITGTFHEEEQFYLNWYAYFDLGNLAIDKRSWQLRRLSSWGPDLAGPQKAVDGDPSTDDNTCAHTVRGGDTRRHAWWLVDLQKTASIHYVHYLNTKNGEGTVITICVWYSRPVRRGISMMWHAFDVQIVEYQKFILLLH